MTGVNLEESSPETTATSLPERLQAVLECNKVCAECPERDPTWACLLSSPLDDDGGPRVLGILCCYKCYGAHFQLGNDVGQVKSTRRVNDWKEEEIEVLENSGNQIVNEIYESKLTPEEKEQEYEQDKDGFIKDKYQEMKYFSKRAFQQHQKARLKNGKATSSSDSGRHRVFKLPGRSASSHDGPKGRRGLTAMAANIKNPSFDWVSFSKASPSSKELQAQQASASDQQQPEQAQPQELDASSEHSRNKEPKRGGLKKAFSNPFALENMRRELDSSRHKRKSTTNTEEAEPAQEDLDGSSEHSRKKEPKRGVLSRALSNPFSLENMRRELNPPSRGTTRSLSTRSMRQEEEDDGGHTENGSDSLLNSPLNLGGPAAIAPSLFVIDRMKQDLDTDEPTSSALDDDASDCGSVSSTRIRRRNTRRGVRKTASSPLALASMRREIAISSEGDDEVEEDPLPADPRVKRRSNPEVNPGEKLERTRHRYKASSARDTDEVQDKDNEEKGQEKLNDHNDRRKKISSSRRGRRDRNGAPENASADRSPRRVRERTHRSPRRMQSEPGQAKAEGSSGRSPSKHFSAAPASPSQLSLREESSHSRQSSSRLSRDGSSGSISSLRIGRRSWDVSSLAGSGGALSRHGSDRSLDSGSTLDTLDSAISGTPSTDDNIVERRPVTQSISCSNSLLDIGSCPDSPSSFGSTSSQDLLNTPSALSKKWDSRSSGQAASIASLRSPAKCLKIDRISIPNIHKGDHENENDADCNISSSKHSHADKGKKRRSKASRSKTLNSTRGSKHDSCPDPSERRKHRSSRHSRRGRDSNKTETIQGTILALQAISRTSVVVDSSTQKLALQRSQTLG